MKTYPNFKRLVSLSLLLVFLLSCCRKNAPQRENESIAQKTFISITSPGNNDVFKCGDSVKIALSKRENSPDIDSLSLFMGKDRALSVKGLKNEIFWNTKNCRTGQTTLRLVAYFSDSTEESHNIGIVLLSEILPENYKYKVVKKYNHDDEAYTQGLIYDNGILYESTGLEGKSSIRIVDINSGIPKKIVNLSSQYFAEGIALYNNQIYQITYKSQVGFVYDKNNLNKIRSFDYQINEGWGLTTDGHNLIMSDGSHHLFFIEPEYYTQVDMLQVFDNKGLIDSLNELEFINNQIFANVYGQTYIVIIDPSTGKVTGKLELKDLLPEGFQNDYDKVLNGIAYNPQTRHLYITGKHWPVLFELQIIP